MKKLALSVAIFVGMSLVGCSTNKVMPSHKKVVHTPVVSQANTITTTAPTIVSSMNSTLAGNIEKSMDDKDKEKMSHALDKRLGKATEWENANTGISYTVVPIKKTTVNGNSFCRKYQVTATRNDTRKEMNGTACVSATDSSWQVVN